ncbi:hypothetical protein AY599_04685 [Leptolyngbya valderiana BDU 20041]|nr:hypothetical protein AY599_04685 [Leptolyngbya valderiana BDU 20041]
MTEHPDEASPQATPRARLRRWFVRFVLLMCLAAIAGAVAIGLLLTPAAGVILRPKLEQELGVRVEGGSLKLDMGGDIIIEGVTFRTPEPTDALDPRGEASRFLHVKRGRILLGWRGKLRGGALVRRVEIFDANVRLTKPLEDFDLNILAVEPPTSQSAGAGSLPSIIVHHASVLLGEHDGSGNIFELRTLPIVASLRSSRESPGAFDVTAFEDAKLSTSVKPLRFEGQLGPDGFSGTLGGIDMADFPPDTIPLQLREVYEELRVGGRTRGATVRYDQSTDVLELVLDFQASSAQPAPFEEDSAIDARLDLRVPVPVDEAGTLRPLIPTSGSGRVRLVQRPAPESGDSISWRTLQAPSEPGESSPGKRTLMVEGSLTSTIEDLKVNIDLQLWLGNAEPLYEFQVATLEPYAFTTDAPWLSRPTPVLEKVSQVLEMFEPAGTVSLSARVAQVAQGEGVRQEVSGRGTIRDAGMQFEYFPYPVSGVSGSIEIDDGTIGLMNLRGATRAGTPVAASTIITLDEVATGVDVDVRALGVPYDDTLRQTLDAVAPEIRQIILNEDALANLYTQGLAREPGTPGRSPAFALGGQADARVRVTRTTGVDNSTTVHVDVRSSKFGLLPEAFPLPIIGTDVLLTVDLPSEQDTILKGKPRFLQVAANQAKATTLAGGDAVADVVVRVPLDEPPGEERSTTVHVDVDATDVPIQPVLLSAIPTGEPREGSPFPDGPRGILYDLRPRGDIDAQVEITRDDRGELDWWAQIQPQEATLSPVAIELRRPLVIKDVVGDIRVDDAGLRGELNGRASVGGEVSATIRADFQSDAVLAVVNTQDLNLQAPVEDAVAVFAPDLARALAEARRTFQVQGVADIAANVRSAEAKTSAEVRIAGVDRLRFDWLGGRMGLDAARGSGIVTTGQSGPLVSFDRIVGEGSFDGESIGRVRMRGEIPLDALREAGSRLERPTTLDIEIQGGRLESRLLRTLAGNRTATESGSFLDRWDVQGEYDALVALRTPAYEGNGTGARPLREFELSPYDASFVREGTRYFVPWISGVIAGKELVASPLGPGGASQYAGEVDYLTLGGDDWWVSLDGFWRSEGGVQSEIEADLDGRIRASDTEESRVRGVPVPLLGMFPTGVERSLEAMNATSDGDITIPRGRLRIVSKEQADPRIEVDALLGLERLLLGTRADDDAPDADRPIAILERAAMSVQSDTEHPLLRATLDLSAAEGRVWGLAVNDAQLLADVRLDGTISLPVIRAVAGGGRVAGRGSVTLGQADGERARYALDLSGSGLYTEQVVAALQDRQPETVRGAGDLDLSLGLEGTVGEPDRYRGRGSMRIRGGSPVELPLAIRAAVEAMNVNFGADQYDAMNGDFYVVGQTLTFTRLAVSSDAVILDGLGTVDLGSGALDMSITTRPTRDTALRSMFRALRDVIVSVNLRGTLDDPAPAPKPQALVGPLDRLRRMIQGGLDYEEWSKERLRRYSRQRGEPDSGW